MLTTTLSNLLATVLETSIAAELELVPGIMNSLPKFTFSVIESINFSISFTLV